MRKTPSVHLLHVLAVVMLLSPATLLAGAGEPCLTETTPETLLLNTLWRSGTAAGNSTDWYRNRDNDHAAIIRTDYPQLNSYAIGVQDYEKNVVDAPRIIIGNASLGISGLYSMVRYWGMDSDSSADQHYTQYLNSQHYWYPSVEIKNDTPTDRDMNIGMFPYASQSVGKSGSELDEMRKFFHTLAAFRPEVKTQLQQQGLLIPTLQMIYRRTRVASDAAYLTGEAHPSAFDDVTNNVAMIQMAQAITTNTIPPMVQIDVLEENYGVSHSTKYNEAGSSTEQQFTTPAAVARIFRGTEYTKRMVLSLTNSYDVNNHSLTYHFAVLRGDESHVRITPLNAEGSKVEVEIDYHDEALVPGTERLSNLVVIGAFVDNGSYYSAPGFITSFSLYNESRVYSDGLLQEINYLNDTIEPSVSLPKGWDKDVYSHDFNGRVVGWNRVAGSDVSAWMSPGFLVKGTDASGRPTLCSDVTYSDTSGTVTYSEPYTGTWRATRACVYTNYAAASNTALTVQTASGVSSTYLYTIDNPANGTLSILANTGTKPKFTYTPRTGFTGVDRFVLKEENQTASTSRIIYASVVVGPADATPPAAPTELSVLGQATNRALISWTHTTDNVEVDGYTVYRDGTPIGNAHVTTAFTDTNLVEGTTYSYTVKAFDHAGNLSGASEAVDGSSAALWGQDDFEDGNYTTADATLTNGLSWTLPSGLTSVSAVSTLTTNLNGMWARVGAGAAVPTRFVTPNTIPGAFRAVFDQTQVSGSRTMGAVFFYQDINNYYRLDIMSDACAVYRVMDGITNLVSRADDLKMRSTLCSAKFAVQAIPSAGGVVIDVTKSEWTTYDAVTNTSIAVQSVQITDTNAAAAAKFTSGQFGFFVDTTNTYYNVARYDNVKIYKLTVNTAPVARNQTLLLPANIGSGLTLTAADLDSTNLTYAIVTEPSHGSLSGLNTGSGAATYTPTTNYSGVDSFEFSVSDGSLSSTGTVSITITTENIAPITDDQAVSMYENTTTNLVLTASDADDPSLSYSIVSGPAHGSLSGLNANSGAVTYTPTASYTGADSFTFSASDGSLSSTGTVSITVNKTPSIYFDFGSTTYLTFGNWNNSTSTVVGLSISNAIDGDGIESGINLRLSATGITVGYSTGVAAADLYPDTAQRDCVYSTRPFSYQIEGADPSTQYRLTFFASKAAATRETLFSVGSSNLVLDCAYNTDRTVVFDVQPDVNGTIDFTVEPNVTNSSGFAYFSALELQKLASATPAGDSDSDGIPDSWETLYFGDPSNADPSAIAANGVNTIYETYIAGLNPTNALSTLTVAGQVAVSQTLLQWGSVSGRVYSVYWTTNLLNSFQPLETNILWPQNSWTDTLHEAENGGFYRIEVQLTP